MYCYKDVASRATQWPQMSFVQGILTLPHSALKHHPDKGGDPELFKEMTHA